MKKFCITDFLVKVLDDELLIRPDLNLMVSGDFNDFDSSFLRSYFSMKNCVESPTRGDSLLDQIWISSGLLEHYISCAEVGPPLGTSDHRTVFLNTKYHPAPVSQKIIKIRDYRLSNLARFAESLSRADFSSLAHESSVDRKCSLFYHILDDAVSCIPVEFVLMNGRDKPWVTPLLKLFIISAGVLTDAKIGLFTTTTRAK